MTRTPPTPPLARRDDLPDEGPDSAALAARLDALCADGWDVFERFDREVRAQAFHPFVAADYDVVREVLRDVRRDVARAMKAPRPRFLEWGSATGVVTIIADLVGFDACGIELDERLVEMARALAARHGSRARFVAGSFLPEGYRYRSPEGDSRTGTIGSGPSGYLQLGHALDEFDVVFGYPWDGEQSLMIDLMRQYGRSDALLLLHDPVAGVRKLRGGRELPPPR